MAPTTTPLATLPWARLLRSLAFALVSVLIGVLGHAASSSCPPQLLVLVAGVPLATTYGWLFTDRRLDPRTLLAGVGALQVVAHGACTVLAPASHHAGHAHAAGAAHITTDVALIPMLVVHVAATLLGLAVLLRLERALWGAVRTTGRIVGRAVGALFGLRDGRYRPAAGRARVAAAATVIPRWHTCTSQWFSSTCGRRGPPRALACA